MLYSVVGDAGPDPDDNAGRARQGMSFEVEVGVADVHSSCRDSPCRSNVYPLSIVAGSVGWWVTPQFAVHVRVFDLFDRHSGSIESVVLVGPGVQYWPRERVWLGAAVGPDVYIGKFNPSVGVAADLRVGFVVFGSRTNALSISAEVSPLVSSDDITTLALLVAYQRL